MAHGIAGGVISSLQGGKFGHGFASAGVAQAFAPAVDGIGGGAKSYAPARILAAAMVGGTSSVLSGGKFASGAVTAAFARAYNDEGSKLGDLDKDQKIVLSKRLIRAAIAYSEKLDSLWDSDPMQLASEIGYTPAEGMSSDNVRSALDLDVLVFRSELQAIAGEGLTALSQGGLEKYFNGSAGPTHQILGVLSATDGLLSRLKLAITSMTTSSSITRSMSAREPIVVSCKYGSGCGWRFNNE
jgi:hypothetical protein